MITKILFVTLSNIGDVVLTLPVMDLFRYWFPDARFTVVVGPRPRELFCGDPAVTELIVFNKRGTLREKVGLLRRLRKGHFDMVIDMRNSLLGVCVPARYKTSLLTLIPRRILHMRERHLWKVRKVRVQLGMEVHASAPVESMRVSPDDEQQLTALLKGKGVIEGEAIAVVAAGARSQTKRWPMDKFLDISARLVREYGIKPVLVGDIKDREVLRGALEGAMPQVAPLLGRTSLRQLIALIARARVVVTNDSAVLHIASYLNVPVVAVFGISDEAAYGPWSTRSAVVTSAISCRPCRKAQCERATLECIRSIGTEEVWAKVKELLERKEEDVVHGQASAVSSRVPAYDRILVTRTDRIGDVLLSTPVLKALRQQYPHAYLAMMVSPSTREIVSGNPSIDEVLILDKGGAHRGLKGTMRLVRMLKEKKFECVLILHPTLRVHLVMFLAGIPRRIGYDCKGGWLLTDRIRHTKPYGFQHELEYNLDLVRYLGITPQEKALFMPLHKDAEAWAEQMLHRAGLKGCDKLLAIHPDASCPSKIWPAERFAETADALALKHGMRVIIVAGEARSPIAEKVARFMRTPVVNLAGETSLSELASLLRRCRLFISNDSGPVHLASAVGVPVISIFGRRQPGLSPRRWHPVGKWDTFLHRDVGCIRCLAHNCTREFSCLKAITTNDVVGVADEILKHH